MLALVAASVLFAPQGSPQLLDARSFIARLKSTASERAIVAKERAYLQEVEDYIGQSPRMPVEESAQKWVALIADGDAVPRRRMEGSFGGAMPQSIGEFSTAFAALPTPEVWPRISAIVDAMPDSDRKLALQLLFARLQGKDDLVLRLCDRIEAGEEGNYALEQTRMSTLQRLRDVQGQVRSATAQAAREGSWPELDDLIQELGPANAATELLGILKTAKSQLRFDEPRNASLGRRVILDHLASIGVPQWQLADGADPSYMRRLVGRYGVDSLVKTEGQGGADVVTPYLLDLLHDGDLQASVALLRKMQYPPRLDYHDMSPGVATDLSGVYPNLVKIFRNAPDCDVGQLYVTVATRTGHAQDAIRTIEAQLASPTIARKKQFDLLAHLADLNAFRGDLAAIERLYRRARALQARPEKVDPTWDATRYGLAMDDRKIIEAEVKRNLASQTRDIPDRLIQQLLSDGRFELAERVIVHQGEIAKRNGSIEQEGAWLAPQLCRLYYHAGRPKDVLTVLTDFPYWDVADLLAMSPTRFPGTSDLPTTTFMAAWALSKTGRTDMAERILRGSLAQDRNDDDAYALLNRLAGGSALAFYDTLQQDNPTETRPLIWKADLLARLGRLAEAESAVREAIADDPLEEQQAIGHRLMAFHVLSGILRKKGDPAGAKQCEDRFQAARLADKARSLLQQGLVAPAEPLLESALRLSPDDFLTHELYAGCLRDEGRGKEADLHYRRCFALAPSAEGRWSLPGRLPTTVGQLFRSEPLALADAAMASLAPDTAARAFAKAEYEEASGRGQAAYALYKRCVALDPEFAGAYAGIAQLAGNGFGTRAEEEAAALECLKLNGSPWRDATGLFSDLAPIYRTIAHGRRPEPTGTKPVFPLHFASKPWAITFGVQEPWNRGEPSAPVGAVLLNEEEIGYIVMQVREGRGGP